MDADTLAKDFKGFLDRQPTGLTVAMQTVADQTDAAQLKKLGDELVVELKYKNITVSNLAVLGEPETKAIEGKGFPRTTWRFVVFLNNRV